MNKNRFVLCAMLAWVASSPSTTRAQQVFHSTQSANLPTAETIAGGLWLFEISHRFGPPVSSGGDALWGLDGPVNNRLGLSYAPTDRLMLGVVRTNNEDNLELDGKMLAWEGSAGPVPLKVGMMAGVAWNMEPASIQAEDNEVQAYAQVMLNVLLAERLALGVVPTYLRNPRIRDVDSDDAVTLGLHGQLYLSSSTSVLAEWIVSEERVDMAHDGGAFGIELETRGHFFKIVLTNQPRMNPTQFLGGAQDSFEPDEWRLGFNITRLLAF